MTNKFQNPNFKFQRPGIAIFVLFLLGVLVFGAHFGAKAEEGTKTATTVVGQGYGCYGTVGITVEYLTANPTSGNAPLPVTLTATVYGFNPPFTYYWDFDGDGTWDESGVQWGAGEGGCTAYSSTHIYDNPGNVNAKFALKDVHEWSSSAVAGGVNITVLPGLCGNGSLDAGEQCDDGNKIEGDGCSAICENEMIVDNKFSTTNLVGQIGNTAEVLSFVPSSRFPTSQNQLLKGIAEVSDDGGKIWQRSIAEVLYVGSTPVVIELDKNDGVSFLSAGSDTEYTIRFGASGFSNLDNITSVNIIDTLSVSDPTQATKVRVKSASYCGEDEDCSNPQPITITASGFNYNTPVIDVRTNHFIKVLVGTDKDIKPSTRIINKAEFFVKGIGAEVLDEDVILNVFAQEDRGGDIYARGDINLGRPIDGLEYNAKYIIGAGGNITQTLSENGFILENYNMRSGSGSDLGDDCASGSVCDTMNKNIARAKKNAEEIFGNMPDRINPNGIPEGGMWIRRGDLNINSDITVSGRGTIIVEGDLNIGGNIQYSKPGDILGFVVLGGDVNIDPGVDFVSGIFYIPDGAFRTGTSGDEDVQLIVEGVVIARSFDLERIYTGVKESQSIFSVQTRKDIAPHGRIDQSNPNNSFDAFCRLATGDGGAIGACSDAPYSWGPYDCWNGTEFKECGGNAGFESGACEEVACITSQKPSEIFRYDGNIVIKPPPLFGNKIIRNIY